MQPMPPQVDVVKVEITQEDILNGKRNRATCCPIALALERVLAKRVYVNSTEFFVQRNPTERISLPKEVCDFIHGFDIWGKESKDVHPLVFWLSTQDIKRIM